jgi:hypothetical protein
LEKGLFDWKDDESFPDYVVGRPHYNNACKPLIIFFKKKTNKAKRKEKANQQIKKRSIKL